MNKRLFNIFLITPFLFFSSCKSERVYKVIMNVSSRALYDTSGNVNRDKVKYCLKLTSFTNGSGYSNPENLFYDFPEKLVDTLDEPILFNSSYYVSFNSSGKILSMEKMCRNFIISNIIKVNVEAKTEEDLVVSDDLSILQTTCNDYLLDIDSNLDIYYSKDFEYRDAKDYINLSYHHLLSTYPYKFTIANANNASVADKFSLYGLLAGCKCVITSTDGEYKTLQDLSIGDTIYLSSIEGVRIAYTFNPLTNFDSSILSVSDYSFSESDLYKFDYENRNLSY